MSQIAVIPISDVKIGDMSCASIQIDGFVDDLVDAIGGGGGGLSQDRVIDIAVDAIMPEYTRRVRSFSPWLEARGTEAGTLIYNGLFPKKAKKLDRVDRPRGAEIVGRFVDPAIEPFKKGLSERLESLLKPRIRGVVGTVSIAMIAAVGASFFAGWQISRKKYGAVS